MINRDAYSASEVMALIRSMKDAGQSEETVALEFGFTKKDKADIPGFRQYLMEQKNIERNEKAELVAELRDEGYCLEAIADKLGISYAHARSLSLQHPINKETSNEKTEA